ncbi:hypothetical protein GLYMA_14G202900v4 [Glycine max]|nr:hypothetical protein JHK87_040655 [Glycine soja]KAG4963954.1 hypothetical protein JHK86_040822 [Glycine max]KRH17162.2 hypothetical protein GLYMA_14G202900v4 [Glycine max]
MESKRNTITLVNKTHLLCNVSFFLFLICTLAFCSITIASSIPCLGKIEVFSMNLGLSRGILSGPGSVPPTCHSKCCKCTPCKPTLCSVHNEGGTYYPLRWLCKCGNKFYNP